MVSINAIGHRDRERGCIFIVVRFESHKHVWPPRQKPGMITSESAARIGVLVDVCWDR
jgi:hypothetical protein